MLGLPGGMGEWRSHLLLAEPHVGKSPPYNFGLVLTEQ